MQFEMREMCGFQLEMCGFHSKCMDFTLKCTKTADFHSNLLVSWELMTGGYQRRLMKCVHVFHAFRIERPLPGTLWLVFRKKDLYLVITQKLTFMKSGGFHEICWISCEIHLQNL